MSARRLLIALCAALAGLGLFAPAHSLADAPAAGPSQVQAPAAVKSSLASVQAPAAGRSAGTAIAAAAPAAATASTASAVTASAAVAAPTQSTATSVGGVSGSPPVVIGAVSAQPVYVAPVASNVRTPTVLTPPPIPAFPELSPARTGELTAHGSAPVVLAPTSSYTAEAPAASPTAPFSAVLGVSASRPETAVSAVPATILTPSSSAAVGRSLSQTVTQAPAVAAQAPKGPYSVQAPKAAAAAPKGPYSVQAAAAPKGPYSAQAPTTTGYGAGGVSAPGYSVAQAAPRTTATRTQLSAVPQLPNAGTGGLLNRPAPPPQIPGALAGLLLAGALGLAAGLSPSRRVRPLPAVRRTSSQRVYWLNGVER